jgi:hypothetical protein
MMAGFGDFFSIPANPLEMGTPQKDSKPTFTLKITVMSNQKISIWLGSLKDLKIENKTELDTLLHSTFVGNDLNGYRHEITNSDNITLTKEIQKVLISLKKVFPSEMKAVISIGGKVKYQDSMDMISIVRTLASEAEPIILKNELGKEEKSRVLFPEIVLSEWDDGI